MTPRMTWMTVTEGRNEDEDDQETYRTPIKFVKDNAATRRDEGIDLEEREVDRMEIEPIPAPGALLLSEAGLVFCRGWCAPLPALFGGNSSFGLARDTPKDPERWINPAWGAGVKAREGWA